MHNYRIISFCTCAFGTTRPLTVIIYKRGGKEVAGSRAELELIKRAMALDPDDVAICFANSDECPPRLSECFEKVPSVCVSLT